MAEVLRGIDRVCVLVCLLSSSLVSEDVKIKICITIILLVVLYGCETGSLASREERRLWVLENRVLRKILIPMRN